MKQRKKRKPVLFWIAFVLAALIWFAVFELGKNTLWGWALLLVLLGLWALLRLRVLPEGGFLLRLGCFAGAMLLPCCLSSPVPGSGRFPLSRRKTPK